VLLFDDDELFAEFEVPDDAPDDFDVELEDEPDDFDAELEDEPDDFDAVPEDEPDVLFEAVRVDVVVSNKLSILISAAYIIPKSPANIITEKTM